MTSQHFDACVVGAGPAGCIAASVLARAGARVALCSSQRPHSIPAVGETVTAETRLMLSRLGLDECLGSDIHTQSAGQCSTWGSDIPQYREAIMNGHGCGWHLDRDRFETQLLEGSRRAGVSVVGSLMHFCQGTSQIDWNLAVKDNQSIRSSYMIDCTGRRSHLALRMGATRSVYDKLIAIWALFQEHATPDRTIDRHTHVQACSDGWFYCAPLPGLRYAVAYFTDGDLVRTVSLRTPEGFFHYLSRTAQVSWPFEVSRCELVAGPVPLSAVSSRLSNAFANRWIAAGDAAQTFDPLSSKGITSAIAGGNNAAFALIDRESCGLSAFRHYQHQLDAEYHAYTVDRREYYGMEQRWAERPFWQRRHMTSPEAERSTRAPFTPREAGLITR